MGLQIPRRLIFLSFSYEACCSHSRDSSVGMNELFFHSLCTKVFIYVPVSDFIEFVCAVNVHW